MNEEMPKGFPPQTLPIQRCLCALEISSPEKLTDAYDQLYHTFWAEGNSTIAKPDTFGPILVKALGEEQAKDVMKRSTEAEAKKKLLDNTDQAFQRGAFGLPWFECTNPKGEVESFWGFDHLGQVLRFLELDGGKIGIGLEEGLRAML